MPLHSYQKRAAAATGISTATLRKLEGARREIRSEKVAAEGMVEDPFPDLAIDDPAFLDTTESRHKCKNCLKSRKFFCYTCCTPNPQIQDKLPRVKLPIKIDIIKHQSESDGKSTCPHAVVMAPEDVTVYTFPCIPDYDREKVVLVFPCKEARTLRDLALSYNSSNQSSIMTMPPGTSSADNDPVNTMINNTSSATTESGLHTPRPDQLHSSGYTDISTSSTYADLQTIWTNAYYPQAGPSANVQPTSTYSYLQTVLCQPQDLNNSGKRMAESQEDLVDVKRMRIVTPPFERAVFIDCTWNQTKNIITDERLKDLRRVQMHSHETQFWRCQEGLPTTFLSTIEAIYHFVREYHEDVLGATYLNEYDNLLFFFVYFYRKIRDKYQGGKGLKAYQRKIEVHDVTDIM
ncbi:tRNA-uridine aminocarboxypropyltransferase 1-like isoform X2 [Littorina saxatilis]